MCVCVYVCVCVCGYLSRLTIFQSSQEPIIRNRFLPDYGLLIQLRYGIEVQ